MAKICPQTDGPVLYLNCMDCKDKYECMYEKQKKLLKEQDNMGSERKKIK